MKLSTLVPFCSFALFAISCDNPEVHNGSSTPIDSTNIHGTAPATYGADDPNAPEHPRYEGRFDSGRRANTTIDSIQ